MDGWCNWSSRKNHKKMFENDSQRLLIKWRNIADGFSWSQGHNQDTIFDNKNDLEPLITNRFLIGQSSPNTSFAVFSQSDVNSRTKVKVIQDIANIMQTLGKIIFTFIEYKTKLHETKKTT